jgi:hypothetical protein
MISGCDDLKFRIALRGVSDIDWNLSGTAQKEASDIVIIPSNDAQSVIVCLKI